MSAVVRAVVPGCPRDHLCPGSHPCPGCRAVWCSAAGFGGGSGLGGGSGVLGYPGSTTEPGSTAVAGDTLWLLMLMSVYGAQVASLRCPDRQAHGCATASPGPRTFRGANIVRAEIDELRKGVMEGVNVTGETSSR